MKDDCWDFGVSNWVDGTFSGEDLWREQDFGGVQGVGILQFCFMESVDDDVGLKFRRKLRAKDYVRIISVFLAI